ncbi:hypothetical protein F4781DRAFT_379371 [Annulohypoxylon bovei var. microspora]|nr:hypothetical protein F4781DRAFT_379371 [Annulohypoxylon bovei var. microspora]
MPVEETAAFKESLLEGPALNPPPGVTPNFENPGGTHALGYGIVILAGVLSCLSVLLRLHSRYRVKSIRLEDGFFLVAFGFFAGQLYIVYDFAIFPGMDVHQWNVQMKVFIHILFHAHVYFIMYILCILFLKTAILLDWLHIFVPLKQRNYMFWVCHAMLWSNVIFYTVEIFMDIFQCTPQEKIWNPLYEGGSCPIDMYVPYRATGILNLISDLCILLLPQKVIWGMNMSRSKKLSISILFAVGIFACVSATVRLIYFDQFLAATDLTHIIKPAAFWDISENVAGFLIMAAPSIRKVFQSIPLPEFFVHLLWPFTRTGASNNYRDGLPSWRKPPFQRRRGPWDITELETSNMMSLSNTIDAKDARPRTVINDMGLE